jgi:hypothetical protein
MCTSVMSPTVRVRDGAHVMETTNLLSKASSVIVGMSHGYDFHRKETLSRDYHMR